MVRTSDTRYFTDPSVAAAALGIGPGDLLRDTRSFGNFFETMAVRDLRCYADALGGSVSHYLDANGLECDAIVHLRDGRFGLVEVKPLLLAKAKVVGDDETDILRADLNKGGWKVKLRPFLEDRVMGAWEATFTRGTEVYKTNVCDFPSAGDSLLPVGANAFSIFF